MNRQYCATDFGAQRHAAQHLDLVGGKPILRPPDGLGRHAAEAAQVNLAGDGPVVVAGDPDRIERCGQGQAGGWVGMVADNVSQAYDPVDPFRGDAAGNSLKAFQIGMDVGNDRVSHRIFRSCAHGA